MMDFSILGNWLICLYLSYLSIYIIKMFFNKNRTKITAKNKRLDELRKIPVKTIEQQKEFIDLRYPKTIGKWTKYKVFTLIAQMIAFIFLVITYKSMFNYFNLKISIWIGLGFIFIIPFFINMILKRFGIQTQDISVFFR